MAPLRLALTGAFAAIAISLHGCGEGDDSPSPAPSPPTCNVVSPNFQLYEVIATVAKQQGVPLEQLEQFKPVLSSYTVGASAVFKSDVAKDAGCCQALSTAASQVNASKLATNPESLLEELLKKTQAACKSLTDAPSFTTSADVAVSLLKNGADVDTSKSCTDVGPSQNMTDGGLPGFSMFMSAPTLEGVDTAFCSDLKEAIVKASSPGGLDAAMQAKVLGHALGASSLRMSSHVEIKKAAATAEPAFWA